MNTESPSSRPRWGIPLGAALSLIVLASAGTFFYFTHVYTASPSSILSQVYKATTHGATSPQTTQGQGVNTASITPTTDVYAGWRTETATTYQLKYPSTWYDQQSLGIAATSPDEVSLSNEKVKVPGQTSDTGIFCASGIIGTLYPEDPDSIALTAPLGVFTVSTLGTQGIVFTKVATLTIAGHAAVEYTRDASSIVSKGQNYSITYVIPNTGKFLELTCELNKSKATAYSSEVANLIQSLSFN